MQRDAEMARAIQNVRAGNTRYGQNRALEDKMLMGGLQATGAMIGGAMQAQQSQTKDINNKNRSIMSGAIDDATRKAGLARAEAAKPSPDYVPNEAIATEGQHNVPSWLQQAQTGQVSNPDYIKEAAKQASATQDLNLSAAGANIGGYRTPSGADAIDADSDTRAADLQTGQNILKATQHMGSQMGGMGRSLARR